MEKVSVDSINETMADAVSHARANHPGWKNISGDAERSIRIIEKARAKPRAVIGRWGSKGIPYMAKLEFRKGRALIRAADAVYESLRGQIRRRWRFGR
jgi:hypothetical protein